MIATDGVRNCIREGKTPQLINALQTGGQYGMQTLESHMEQLVLGGIVTPEDAVAKANSAMTLIQNLERSGVRVSIQAPGSPPPTQPQRPSTQNLAERFAQAAGIPGHGAPPQGAPPQAAPHQGAPMPPPPQPVAQTAGGGNPQDDFEKFRQNRSGR